MEHLGATMLLQAIESNKTYYSEDEVGTVLADSDADLGDEDACVGALHAAGVRPWQFNGSLMCARIAAHNIRTQRKILSRSWLRLKERADA
jgi:hypothetical protein